MPSSPVERKQWELHAELGEEGHSVAVAKSQNAFVVSGHAQTDSADGYLELYPATVCEDSTFLLVCRWRWMEGRWRSVGSGI